MAVYFGSATLTSGVTTTAVKIAENAYGCIKQVQVDRASSPASGTQWQFNFYKGHTGNATLQFVAAFDVPAVANDFPVATEATTRADAPPTWDFRNSGSDPRMYSAACLAAAPSARFPGLQSGAGAYVTIQTLQPGVSAESYILYSITTGKHG